ncbi:MAG: bifunctional phosphopantothenoylcysteine decarboxylase/phosphopantothenate--cysteine ligase CoaBC [Promethearchaeia archaeon]
MENGRSHPSKDIKSSKGNLLYGKNIYLCITGSVASITSPIIARELMRYGAEVYPVLSQAATKLITPRLMEWATGNETITKIDGKVEHVEISAERPSKPPHADLILLCPATANSIGKIASGITDTPPTLICYTALSTNVPILVVPAMHASMFNSILESNIQKLKKLGVEIMGPRLTEGKAKVPHVDDIVDRSIDIVAAEKDLQGLRFLITGGPTRQYIDEIRFISNDSTGKMGIELAKEVRARGGEVLLLNGKSSASVPDYIDQISCTSTEDFVRVVTKELSEHDWDFFISAAALSDYTPTEECISEGKISSDKVKELNISLRLTPKLINQAAKINQNTFIVGFKAETNVSKSVLIDRGYERLKSSGIDLIICNDVSRKDIGFESNYNEVYIVNADKRIVHVPKRTKRYVASRIVDVALENYRVKEEKH